MGSSPFEELSNARMHAIVHAEIERLLAPRGFEPAADLKWVRGDGAPIRWLFGFSKLKGGVIVPRWGISLDFTPHVSGSQLRWHRSNKAALLDLGLDAQWPELAMTFIAGEQAIRKRHPQVAKTAIRHAEDFWGRCGTIADLPGAIDWLKTYFSRRDGLGFYNYVQHPMAAALVFAQLGRRAEAMAEWEHVESRSQLRPDSMRRLRAVLDAAIQQPNPDAR